MAEGRHERALSLLRTRHEGNPMWFEERALRAEALAALGRTDEAVALALSDVTDLRRWGSPRGVGRALRALGELRRDHADLLAAIEVLAGTRARLEHARALFALGDLDRNPPMLRDALRLAEECGAAPLRSRVAAALAALGEQVPAQPSASLTTGERRIASLAVGGADDRKLIADAGRAFQLI